MTTVTIKVNERNKAGKAFLVWADAFLVDQSGIEVIKSKKATSKKQANKRTIMELSKKINKAATKRMFETLGLDYDSYNRQ